MKIVFALLVLLHGVIHLLGFLKAYDIVAIKALTQPIDHFRGLLWLLAFLLFVAAAVLYWRQQQLWWLLAIAGAFISQVLIHWNWQDAKFGTWPNVIILIVAALGYFQYDFKRMVKEEIAMAREHQNENAIDSLKKTSSLPPTVEKWLEASGARDFPEIAHVKLDQNFKLKLKPDQTDWYSGTAHQQVWTAQPEFIWAIDLKMMPLVYAVGRDRFSKGEGAMLIKMMSVVPVVNVENNPKINQGALQRYLAEMLWYPTFAMSEYVAWEAIDEQTAKASMDYMGTIGACTFYFNADGMPDRVSAMRYRGGDEAAVLAEWVIDVQEIKTWDGIRIPNKCSVTWRLDSGDWTWAELEVTDYSWE